jgi:outer membrane protein OmpA-like peptidoglycan-associated protein
MNRTPTVTALVAACGLFVSSLAGADPVYIGQGEKLRPIDVARALAGENFKPSLRRRGLEMEPSVEPTALDASERSAAPVASAERSTGAGLDVAIAFAFDSDQLLPDAHTTLDALAEGIKLIDPTRPVHIVGHTDAIGSEPYNFSLSERRAVAVKRYLVEKHGIAAARLHGQGRGERELLLPNAPASGKNRRVGFALG